MRLLTLLSMLVSSAAMAGTAQVNNVAQPGLASAGPAAIMPLDSLNSAVTGTVVGQGITLSTTLAGGDGFYMNLNDFSNDRSRFQVETGKTFQILSVCTRTLSTVGAGFQLVVSDTCPANSGTAPLNPIYSGGGAAVYNFFPSNTVGEEACTNFYATLRAGKCLSVQAGSQSAGGVRVHGIYK